MRTMRRLDQILANLGYCSRREARAFLKAHAVTAQDKPISNAATKVDPANVQIDGQPLDHPDGLLLLLHKPLGLVCSHEERDGPNIYSLLPERWRARNPVITSVGRLDKDTSGLLLLTDQSQLVHRLTSPKHKVPKTYHATLDREPPAGLAELFAAGTLTLEGEKQPCAPATLTMNSSREAKLILTEGKYHQVRRMFASQGCEVLALHRPQLGELTLDELAPGKWRELPLDTFAASS